MSRTAHHRIRNTLNSVSFALSRLNRSVKDPLISGELGVVAEHIRSFGIVHTLLADNTGDNEKIALKDAIALWCEGSEPKIDFEIMEDSDLGALESTFISGILQFLSELRAQVAPPESDNSVTVSLNNRRLGIGSKIKTNLSRHSVSPTRLLFLEGLTKAVTTNNLDTIFSELNTAGSASIDIKQIN